MAHIDPIPLTLRDGSPVIIRTAGPADARAASDYLADLHANDGAYLLTQPGEFDHDEDKVAEKLAKSLDDPRSIRLLAWSGATVVGDTMFEGNAKRRIRHTGWLGLGVRPAWQRRGLGRALMESLLNWAAANGEIERVTLKVYTENARALALYRSLGFVEESHTLRAFKLDDEGGYADEHGMCLYVKPGAAPAGFRTWPLSTP